MLSDSTLYRILVHPLFIGLLGGLFHILTEKTEKKLKLQYNPFFYLSMLFSVYFFIGIYVSLYATHLGLIVLLVALYISKKLGEDNIYLGLSAAGVIVAVSIFWKTVLRVMFPYG